MKHINKYKAVLSVILAITILVCTISVITIAASPDKKTVFNAADDFSEVVNPNGPWSYEVKLPSAGGSSYSLHSYNVSGGYWNGNATRIHKVNDGDKVTTNSAPMMMLAADGQVNEASLAFTAPYTGTVTVKMVNGGVFSPTQSVDAAKFSMTFNDKVQKSVSDLDNSYNANGNRFFTDTVELNVNKDDVIRFNVGRNIAQSAPVYFNPEIEYTKIEENKEQQTQFIASDDYTTTKNPSGNWGYEALTASGYVPLTYSSDTWSGNAVRIATNAGDKVTTNVDTVMMLACDGETNDASLVFRAPYSGDITVQMKNGGVFSPAQSSDAVTFKMLHNTTTVKSVADLDNSYNAKSSRFFTDTVTLTVKKGDEIRFNVHRNASIGGSNVYLNPQIDYTKIEENKEQQTQFIASDDYTTTKNPSGNWGYEALTASGYVPLTYSSDTWSGNAVRIATNAGDKVTTNVDTVMMLACDGETNDASLVFKAPYSGDITVQMKNGGVFSPAQSSDAVTFKMLHNTTTVKSVADLDNSYNAKSSRFFTDTVTLTVKKGDEIRFNVHRNASIGGSNVYFNPQIDYIKIEDDKPQQPDDPQQPDNPEEEDTLSKYIAVNEYSTTSNPSDCWSYETKVENNYIPMKYSNNTWSGNSARIATAVGDKVTTNTDTVMMLACDGQSNEASLTFTVPYSGNIAISMANGGVFSPTQGDDAAKFSMLYNDVVIKSVSDLDNTYNSKSNRFFTDTVTLDVKAGDKIRFNVGRNVARSAPVYFNPQIAYTYIDQDELALRFDSDASLQASNKSKTGFTVSWPSAKGGTLKYDYSVYISTKPLDAIPESGKISVGEERSYTFEGLKQETPYYILVSVFDGKDTAFFVNAEAILTYGNTYTFIADESYTEAVQPINTPWRWCCADKGTLNNITELDWNIAENRFGNTNVSILNKVASDLVTGNSSLYIHPAPTKDAVIKFIAPYTGKITVSMANGGVFAPTNGAAQKYDGINFKLLKNNTEIYNKNSVSSKNSHSDVCMQDAIELDIKRGEMLYFIVNINTSSSGDSTYLNPKVFYSFVDKSTEGFQFMPGASFAAKNPTKNSFELNWSAAYNPDGGTTKYNVWISLSPINGKPNTAPIYSGTALNTVCKGLKIGTQYYVFIEAISQNGETAYLTSNNTVSTECPSFNGYDGYNSTNAPGLWNYTCRNYDGEKNEYTYSLLTDNKKDGFGVSQIALIQKIDKNPVTGSKSMYMHPGVGGKSAAIVFTAPYSGKIDITTTTGGVFCPNNGKDQEFDGICFKILKNNSEILKIDRISNQNNPVDKRLFTKPVTININYGDHLYFIVEANSSNAADSTYFNPLIEYKNVTGGNGVAPKTDYSVLDDSSENTVSELFNKFIFRNNKEYANAEKATAVLSVNVEKTPYKMIALIGLAVISAGALVLLWFCFPNKKQKIKK